LVVIVYRNLVSLKGSNKVYYYYLLLYYDGSMQKSTKEIFKETFSLKYRSLFPFPYRKTWTEKANYGVIFLSLFLFMRSNNNEN